MSDIGLNHVLKKRKGLFCRFAVLSDLPRLALNIRKEDRNEIYAGSGLSPLAGLIYSFKISTEVFTVCEEDTLEPVFIFGYRIMDPPDLTACIWLLGTDKIKKHKRVFLEESRIYLDYMQGKAKLLYNYVDSRNIVHIRWLKWLDFKFIQIKEKFGYEQIPFIEFVRLRN